MERVVPAPICRPHPTPAVAIQLGADHDPSASRAMTIPEPALPEKTNPALRIVKTAKPIRQLYRTQKRQAYLWHVEVRLWG